VSAHPFLSTLERPLVLASASPRRAEILTAQGLQFTVQPAHVPEIARDGEAPVELAQRLAREKARAVAAAHPDAVVLGCDTIVIVDDDVLGKPGDFAEAVAMLRRLSGAEHEVISAVALCQAVSGWLQSDFQSTRVWFRPLSTAEIEAYVATGEPMDKAGAYGIQGAGALLVERIDGGYFNVMGLPLQALRRVWIRLAGDLQPRAAEGGRP
jgi:septum formation protein